MVKGTKVIENEIFFSNEVVIEDYSQVIEYMEEKNIKMVSKSKRDYSATKESIEVLSKYNNKSEAIRALFKEGMSKSEIANLLNIRYQHVRNVLMYEKKKDNRI